VERSGSRRGGAGRLERRGSAPPGADRPGRWIDGPGAYEGLGTRARDGGDRRDGVDEDEAAGFGGRLDGTADGGCGHR